MEHQDYCASCGKPKKLSYRDGYGSHICQLCYRNTRCPHQTCCECGQDRPVNKFLPDGSAICLHCYQSGHRPQHICVLCGKLTKANQISENGPVCGICYAKHCAGSEPCIRCGKVAPVIQRTENGGSLCLKCYDETERPRFVCALCGKERTKAKQADVGPVCHSCYNDLPERQAAAFNHQTRRRHAIGEQVITKEEWLSIMESTNWTCFYCDKPLSKRRDRTIDHIKPLSKHPVHNVQAVVPACRSCNSAKGAKTLEEWVVSKRLPLWKIAKLDPELALRLGTTNGETDGCIDES